MKVLRNIIWAAKKIGCFKDINKNVTKEMNKKLIRTVFGQVCI